MYNEPVQTMIDRIGLAKVIIDIVIKYQDLLR